MRRPNLTAGVPLQVYTHGSVPKNIKQGRNHCCPACNIVWCGCFTSKQDKVPGTPHISVALASADAVQHETKCPTITPAASRQAHTSVRERGALDPSRGHVNAAESRGVIGQQEQGDTWAYDCTSGPRGADMGSPQHRRECSGNQAIAFRQAVMQSPGSLDGHGRGCSNAMSSVQSDANGLKELRLGQSGCLADEHSHVQIQAGFLHPRVPNIHNCLA